MGFELPGSQGEESRRHKLLNINFSKKEDRTVLLGDREFPGNQLKKKFLTWAPVERKIEQAVWQPEQK